MNTMDTMDGHDERRRCFEINKLRSLIVSIIVPIVFIVSIVPNAVRRVSVSSELTHAK
jgi:hypothetical protein